MIERQIGGWTLITDVGLMTKLKGLRAVGLPQETGGVLLGTDLIRRIVYLSRNQREALKGFSMHLNLLEERISPEADCSSASPLILSSVRKWPSDFTLICGYMMATIIDNEL
jgi:hypothetical protein